MKIIHIYKTNTIFSLEYKHVKLVVRIRVKARIYNG